MALKKICIISFGVLIAACQPASQDAPANSAPSTAETSAPTAPQTPTGTLTSTDTPTPTSTQPVPSTGTDTPVEEADISPETLLASLPAPYNGADYDKGRKQFAKCRSCHLVDEGAGHRVGPNLHGVFSRSIGGAEGFPYSKAVQEADFEWTPERLNEWLANPKQFLPGNRMTFAGIADATQRENLIAYLMVETQ